MKQHCTIYSQYTYETIAFIFIIYVCSFMKDFRIHPHLVEAEHRQSPAAGWWSPPQRLLQSPGHWYQEPEHSKCERGAPLIRIAVSVMNTENEVWDVQSHSRHLHSLKSSLQLSPSRRMGASSQWFLCSHWSASSHLAVIGPSPVAGQYRWSESRVKCEDHEETQK